MSRLRVITFKLDPYTIEKLDKLAKDLGLDRSDLIRLGIMVIIHIFRTAPLYIVCKKLLEGEKHD